MSYQTEHRLQQRCGQVQVFLTTDMSTRDQANSCKHVYIRSWLRWRMKKKKGGGGIHSAIIDKGMNNNVVQTCMCEYLLGVIHHSLFRLTWRLFTTTAFCHWLRGYCLRSLFSCHFKPLSFLLKSSGQWMRKKTFGWLSVNDDVAHRQANPNSVCRTGVGERLSSGERQYEVMCGGNKQNI